MVDLFVYVGLDAKLDPIELEQRALMFDVCAVIPKNGHHYAVKCSPFGEDAYYNPTHITWAQPVLGSGTKLIGERCAVLWNTALSPKKQGHVPELIDRYATQLADIEASISIAIVNSRMTNAGVAKDEQTRRSFDAFYKKIRAGTFTAMHTGTILDMYDRLPDERPNDDLAGYFFARDNILRALWSELGIEYVQHKRTVTISDEVSGSNATLDCSLLDMYRQRLRFIEEYNRVFDRNAKVFINPIYLERPGSEEEEGEVNATE
ncbi:MAG: hypothetical protein J6T77_02640 [Clostridia bacterium]|nr:hypothetical protein [Clostridia bacterium]